MNIEQIEKIIRDTPGDIFRKKKIVSELSQRQPPRLSDTERAAAVDLKENIKTLKSAWDQFTSRVTRAQQDFVACQAELHRLKNTCDPDDEAAINRLTFLNTKLQVLSTFTGGGNIRKSEMLNAAENYFRTLDAMLVKHYGKSSLAVGGSLASAINGELSMRLELALFELEGLLKQP